MKVIRDNIYLMKLGGKPGRNYFIVNVLINIYWAINGVYSSVFLPTALIYGIAGKISFTHLLVYIAIFFGFMLFQATVINYVHNIYLTKMNIEFNKQIGLLLADRALKLDMQKFDDSKFFDGCQLTSNNLTAKIYSSYDLTSQVISNIVGAILNTTTIILFSYQSLAIFTIAAIFMWLPAIITTKTNIRVNKENIHNTRRFGFVQNSYNSIHLAKEFKEDKFHQLVLDEYEDVYKSAVALIKKYIGILVGANVVQSMGGSLVLNLGVIIFLSYQTLVLRIMEWTNILAVHRSIQNLIGVVNGFSNIIIKYGENSAYVDGFKELIEYKPIMNSGNKEVDHHKIESITFSDVTFQYPKTNANVLKKINVSIGKNEKVALVGRNGAGKTTFLKLLLRFYDPNEGKILVNGTDIKEYDLKQYQNEFGVLFQDTGLMEVSVRENVLFESDNSVGNEKLDDALEMVNLKKKVSNLLHGADTTIGVEIDNKGTLLSGGEQQRVLLARVIANEKSIVLLDEPTSHMDTITESDFYRDVFQILDQQIVFFITHRLISTVNADKIIVFDKDQIVECGTHEELMKQKRHYYKMFSLQQKMYKMGDDLHE